MDEKWKKIEGNRETELAVKHVAERSTAGYTGKLITVTKTMVRHAEGVDVTWDLAIGPEPRGEHFELCVSIPAVYLAHLPRAGTTHDVQRSAEKLELSSLAGKFELDVSGSSHPLPFDDRRSVAWSKKLRLRFARPYDSAQGLRARAAIRFRATPSALPAFVPLNVSAFGNGVIPQRDCEAGGLHDRELYRF